MTGPGSILRFQRERTVARRSVVEAVTAARRGDADAVLAALQPLARGPVMFLACAHLLEQISRVLPQPLGRHDCDDPICPIAQAIVDGHLTGDRQQALRQMAMLIQDEPEAAGAVLEYLLGAVLLAIEAGRLTLPQRPERN